MGCLANETPTKENAMFFFIVSALSFLSVAGNTDSVFIDQVADNVAVVEVVTGPGYEDWTTVEMPTVPGKRGLKEGQRIGCETVGPRLDGTKVVICGGSVAAYIDIDGSRRANPYFKGTTYTVSNRCEQD